MHNLYILWRSTRSNHSLDFGLQEHDCLKVDDDAKIVMADADPEPEQVQDHSKDYGKELIEVNFAKEGGVYSLSLLVLAYLSRIGWHTLNCWDNTRIFYLDSIHINHASTQYHKKELGWSSRP